MRSLVALAFVVVAACNDYEAPPPAYPVAPAPGDVADPNVDPIAAAQGDAYADQDPSALTDFRPALEGHGAWVDDETYGTVWVPSAAEVGPDFQPYVSAGHWAYEDDYVWVSDYEWGWAPFHYGRWVYIAGSGWAWIPGRVYAGAWVVWRVGDDGFGYVGWGPMPPYWYWRGGVAVRVAVVPAAPYVFCARGDLFAPRVAGHVVVGERVPVIAGQTRPYAPAQPVVAGARVAGPAPARFGYAPGSVPRVGAAPSVTHAQQFARPSTAQPLGARPPAVRAMPSVAPRGGGAVRAAPRPSGGGRRR